MNAVERVVDLLGKFSMIQVRQVMDETGDQLTILFRTLDPQAWAKVVNELLRVEEVLADDAPFTLHICRLYVRSEGKLRYISHMTVQGPRGLEEALEGFATLLEELLLEKHVKLTHDAPEPPPAPAVAPAQTKPAPQAEQKAIPNPTVQVVPLVGQSAARNRPANGLWKSGSKGAHLIKGPQQ
jgi:hypothetical protein